jgi:minimal CRISPR polymerase domain
VASVYITADGDGIGQKVGRMRLDNDVDGVRREAQNIDRGNEIFARWAESHGGSLIEAGGDEVTVEVPAAYLDELPDQRRLYAERVGATVSVGVGWNLRESARALLAAKLRGRNQIVFYGPGVDQELEEAERRKPDETKKLVEEYLAPVSKAERQYCLACKDPLDENGHCKVKSHWPPLEKADQAGYHKAAAAAPPAREPKEHSEAEVARAVGEGAPAPERTHAAADFGDVLKELRQHADAGDEREASTGADRQAREEEAKKRAADALKAVKKVAPLLEQLRGQVPEVYKVFDQMAKAVMELGRASGTSDKRLENDRSIGQIHKSEDLEKAERGAPRGFVDPQGKFHEFDDSLDHHEWIGKQIGAGDERDWDHAYQRAMEQGWMGIGVGGAENVQADAQILSNPNHPATKKVREVARLWGPSFRAIKHGPGGLREDSHDTKHFIGRGALVPPSMFRKSEDLEKAEREDRWPTGWVLPDQTYHHGDADFGHDNVVINEFEGLRPEDQDAEDDGALIWSDDLKNRLHGAGWVGVGHGSVSGIGLRNKKMQSISAAHAVISDPNHPSTRSVRRIVKPHWKEPSFELQTEKGIGKYSTKHFVGGAGLVPYDPVRHDPTYKSEDLRYQRLVKDEGAPIRLVHYSVKPGLKAIGVDRMGTGSGGSVAAEYRQGVPEVGRSYWYHEGARPEPIVVQGAKAKYATTLDPSKHRLYDLARDPEGLRQTTRERFLAGEGGETPEDTLLAEVKRRGYHGYSNAASGLPGAVALFYPQRVKELQKDEAGPPAEADLDALAHEYMREAGLRHGENGVHQTDEALLRRAAEAYEGLKHDPDDPEVKAAYDALKRETLAQYDFLKRKGFSFSPHPFAAGTPSSFEGGASDAFVHQEGAPYSGHRELLDDIRRNKHLHVFNGGDIPSNHSLATPVPGGGPLPTYMDVFRAVHDVFGHAKSGADFGQHGEDQTWHSHMPMYSGPAQRALTTETRGQNAAFHYGKNGEHNRKNPSQAIYPDQKAALMPPEFSAHPSNAVAKAGNDLEACIYCTGQRPKNRARLEKAALPMPEKSGAKLKRVVLPPGTQLDDRVKVQHADGGASWRQVRSGMIMSQDPSQHPTSSRTPNSK